MVEVELNKIIIDERRHDQLIVLKEKKGNRLLPIVIGLAEASAIKLKLSGFQPPRPLTHDLVCDLLKTLGAQAEKVVIDKLEENTFYAKIVLKNHAGEKKIIDARPSDSIALALRLNIPIFVEEKVMQQAQSFDL